MTKSIHRLARIVLLGSMWTCVACNETTRPSINELVPNSPSVLLNAAGRVHVSPGAMHSWAFVDDQRSASCTDTSVCRLASGPAAPPLGSGSAELATPTATDGFALVLQDYKGTRLDHITELRYATYRQSMDAGNNLAIALQLTADFDLSDASNAWQGRLVFEPYHAQGGEVVQSTWQSWDAKEGKWWGTRANVIKNGVSTTNTCVQATPCTWAKLLTAFPNVGIHLTYGSLILKAGSNWAGFRGNVDNLTIGVEGLTTTFDFESSEPATVPALPPDTLPLWIHADTNVIDGGEILAGPLAKNVIVVAFEPATSPQLRATALATVGGIVVGGIPIDTVEGFYYVRPAHGETAAEIMAAAETVNLMQGVVLSAPALLGDAEDDYRKPFDGPTARDWTLMPDSADGDNWALERIGAPSAWGCSTGDTLTKIAVIDRGFHSVDDLRGNVQGNTRYSLPTPGSGHGTSVASIIAASGDNGTGMTGVMWKADLRLYERAPTSMEQLLRTGAIVSDITRMISAVLSGARVINVSGHIGNMRADSAGRANVEYQRRYMRMVLRLRNGDPRAPLFVFAAGNANQNAYYNGYPALVLDYPNRVLAVAAAAASGNGLYQGSNFGPLVHIAAPGERLQAINEAGVVTSVMHRTSGAAPYVAGVAGLLASFDPNLSVSDIRALIVAGALAGGRTAGGIPMLNAHESLKLAAQRPGAPLCGNRIWNDGNNNIVVQRDSVTTETIITRDPTDYLAYVNPFHGGRRIELGFSYRYDWSPATRRFVEGTYVQTSGTPPTDVSGAWLSYTYVADHDNLMWAQRIDTLDATGQVSRLQLLKTSDRSLVADLLSQHLPGTARPPSPTCKMLYPVTLGGEAAPFVAIDAFSQRYECAGYGPVGAWDAAPSTVSPPGEIARTPILGSVAPQGDAVFVPVSIRHMDIQRGEFFVGGCNAFDADSVYYNGFVRRKCTVETVNIDSAVSAMVYRVDTTTKQWTLIPLDPSGSTTLANREINSLAVSEDGKEIMISTTRRASYAEFDLARSCHDETLEWISIDRSSAPQYRPGTVIKRVSLPQGAACGGWVEAGGTVSPSRTGLSDLKKLGPATSRARARPMYMTLRQQEALRARAKSKR